jgi:hypothetical protein
MAKTKDKKPKKTAKAGKNAAPGGIERDLAGPVALLAEFAQSKLARELAASALAAVASALVTRRDDAVKSAARPERKATEAKPAGGELAGLVAQGLTALLASLNQPKKPADDGEAGVEPPPRPKPKLVP